MKYFLFIWPKDLDNLSDHLESKCLDKSWSNCRIVCTYLLAFLFKLTFQTLWINKEKRESKKLNRKSLLIYKEVLELFEQAYNLIGNNKNFNKKRLSNNSLTIVRKNPFIFWVINRSEKSFRWWMRQFFPFQSLVHILTKLSIQMLL